jgi:hypothetical protein
MGKSIGRKRKRQFCGNQYSKAKTNIASGDDRVSTISASKLGDISVSEQQSCSEFLSRNRIFDLAILSGIFSELSCPNCYSNNLNLEEDSIFGLCSHFVLKCQNCEYLKSFASSKKTVNEPEINKRFVYGMRQIGRGFTSAHKLCSTLNLPHLSNTAYKKHQEKLLKAVTEVAEVSMVKAAEEVIAKKGTNE